MLQPKAVIKFSLIATAVYAALTWTWPVLERTYAGYFQGFGNVTFAQFWLWPNAKVDFLDARSKTLLIDAKAKLQASPVGEFNLPKKCEGVKDTLMILQNRNVPTVAGFVCTSSRLIGYTPTAVLISLVIATPIAWRRRWWLLFWGMILLHMVIAVRLTALLLDTGFADPNKAYALFRPGKVMRDIIERAGVILADNPTFAYIVAVFVWIVTLFLIQLWYEWRDGRRDARAQAN